MNTSSLSLFTASQIRECERLAYSLLGIGERELMESAGIAAFLVMKEYFPSAKYLVFYCGSGNNAGDGYVMARLAKKAGLFVTVLYVNPPQALSGTAASASKLALEEGVDCRPFEERFLKADLIIDALLGIGCQAGIKGPYQTIIRYMNEHGAPIFSLDLPSGLEADTGFVKNIAVKATRTLTFIARKVGMYTLDGPDYCGEISCDDLKISACVEQLVPVAHTLRYLPSKILPKRPQNCHKGMFGHVLVIGGGKGMPGAVQLASLAALRTGAGLVTVATHPFYAKTPLFHAPEALVYGIKTAEEIRPLLQKASVCLIGPGLGEDDWAYALWQEVSKTLLPLVVDASALHFLAQAPCRKDHWILTPHPGEAASLLQKTSQDVQKDRIGAIRALHRTYGGTIVLKGVGSLVCTLESTISLCPFGNPAMASAGMGDILAGIIAGLLAQGLTIKEAALYGVLLHAKAGDAAFHEQGERGILASDLFPYIQKLVNGCTQR